MKKEKLIAQYESNISWLEGCVKSNISEKNKISMKDRIRLYKEVIEDLEELDKPLKDFSQEEAIWFDEAAERLGVMVIEKPHIPKSIYNWIKSKRHRFNTVSQVLSYINSYGWDDDNHIEHEIYKFLPDNEEAFIYAWFNTETEEKKIKEEQS